MTPTRIRHFSNLRQSTTFDYISIECTPDSEKAFYEQRRAIWGGWNITIEEMIAEGDRVVVRWTSHGVHQGETQGLPPTGRRVNNSGVNIFRIADGKIAEVWDIWDRLWLWQQLGVLPELKEAIAQARDRVSSKPNSESV
ncbi:MAG: ester cyclase [Anaerolineales bacterium]|nr:MAG: ester cyclase [Anaerolineales bacterium]